LGVVVGVWWAVSASGIVSASSLPSPARVWSSLWSHIRDGTIGIGAERSILRLAFGMLVAGVFGTVIGVAMAASQPIQRGLGGLVVGLQSLPPIAWLPLAVLWMGLTERAVVFVVIVGAFPAI